MARDYERTRKSLINSIVALTLQVTAIVVGFFARKAFLDYLGTEIMGLSTTVQSILGFLNLAELGIGSAVAVTLYAPLLKGEEGQIREIVAIQGYMYRIIALIIFVASCVLLPFFPQIFSRTDLPVWYAYATFGVFLYDALLGYFSNYRQIVLSADQKEYKVLFCRRGIAIIKLLSQMLAIKYMDDAYIWWIGIEFFFDTLTAVILNKVIYRSYPYLKELVSNPRALIPKYPGITGKVRQIFVHRLGSFAMNQLSPVFIYSFASLTLVAYYANYTLLTTNLALLLGSVFTGIQAGIGNMVAEGDRKLILKVFRELFSSRFLVVGICSICLWILTQPFITVWLGDRFLLPESTLAIIIAIFFFSSLRSVVDSYNTAYGLFRDIWVPFFDTAVTVVLSIVLGRSMGLDGVLLAVLAPQLLTGLVWKPYFLFKNGLKASLTGYFTMYAKHLAIGAASFAAVLWFKDLISIDPSSGIWNFLLYALMVFAAASLIFGGLLLACEQGMRDFLGRMRNVITGAR